MGSCSVASFLAAFREYTVVLRFYLASHCLKQAMFTSTFSEATYLGLLPCVLLDVALIYGRRPIHDVSLQLSVKLPQIFMELYFDGVFSCLVASFRAAFR